MIRARVRLDRLGALSGFSVQGHADSAPKGEDLVCAAASLLFRSTARLLELQPDFRITGGAESAGSMELRIVEAPEPRRQWLIGVTELLVRGARDLEEENPGALTLRLSSE